MGAQSVYSTSIKNNRSFVECLLVSREKYISFEKFVVDTGARYTCCGHTVVDKALEESHFGSSEMKLIGGIVKGEYLKFYKYHLRQFTIGSIDLGMQDIWITFDERITDIILGMDILKQLILILNPYNQKVYFCKDSREYHDKFELTVRTT